MDTSFSKFRQFGLWRRYRKAFRSIYSSHQMEAQCLFINQLRHYLLLIVLAQQVFDILDSIQACILMCYWNFANLNSKGLAKRPSQFILLTQYVNSIRVPQKQIKLIYPPFSWHTESYSRYFCIRIGFIHFHRPSWSFICVDTALTTLTTFPGTPFTSP